MEKLNADFKKTCRLLFGQEVGELPDFAPYLSEMYFPCALQRSALSGRRVCLSGPYYPEGAKYASQSEVGKVAFEPLSINQIKDIDSLFGAAAERAVYCGNKFFGTCLGETSGDNVANCAEVRDSYDVYSSKYVAYCSIGRYSESIYGVSGFRGVTNSMRCAWCAGPNNHGAARCFETYASTGISGSYYAYNCSGSNDLMFCFNMLGKSHCIGNLQLTREEYAALKAKLMAEMAEKLRKDRRLFSIVDLVGAGSGRDGEEAYSPPPKSVEKAFASCCRVVLGREIGSPEKYARWLTEKTMKARKVKGMFGSSTHSTGLPAIGKVPASRLATFSEALAFAQRMKISLKEGEAPSLPEIASRAGKIAVFTCEKLDGRNLDISETPAAADSTGVHRLWYSFCSMLSGYSTLVTESKYIFGGYYRTLNCEFLMNCYSPTQCSKSLECDSCFKCRSCYFCHNCENVEEGILCFNLKGGRYAVLNQQLPKEEYLRIKRMLLDYINKELEEKGRLERSIFALALPHPEAKERGKPAKPA
jgi:hypothetical protein